MKQKIRDTIKVVLFYRYFFYYCAVRRNYNKGYIKQGQYTDFISMAENCSTQFGSQAVIFLDDFHNADSWLQPLLKVINNLHSWFSEKRRLKNLCAINSIDHNDRFRTVNLNMIHGFTIDQSVRYIPAFPQLLKEWKALRFTVENRCRLEYFWG